MPVKKIRDLQEMEDSLWRAIARVWSFAARTVPRHFPPGVPKHRSIEDAQRLRDQWEEADFQAFWKRRGVKPETLGAKKP